MSKYGLIINNKVNVIYIPKIGTDITNIITRQKNYIEYLDKNNICYKKYTAFRQYSGEKLVVYDITKDEGIKDLSEQFMYINDEDEIINIEIYNSKTKLKGFITLEANSKKYGYI